MAEVAGLVLGAVGIAGVIGAFKDTIDLFNIIADSRRLGRDYEILETKLDIEKTLLLQWAERVQLLEQDYDKRLDDAHTQALVTRILSCIGLLLSDSTELQQRYGLGRATENSLAAREGHSSRLVRMSQPRMDKFIREFETLRLRVNIRQNTTTLASTVRWVIRDKQKFDGLIQQLAHFTTKINEVVPFTNPSERIRALADEDLKAIRDLRTMKVLLEASSGLTKAIADSVQCAIDKTLQNRILAKLWFRRIDDRRESIATAHHETLHWALQPPEGSFPWHDLSEWLRTSSGIYWISGKAGSGKSTLMKYLHSHDRTRHLLSLWAENNQYSLSNFFFSNLGTVEQKSQEGLSRALLHQVLSDRRSLIAEALPSMWKEFHDTEEDPSLPSLAETRYAFEVIARTSHNLGRVCFFIDGLDEFDGNFADGVSLVTSLAANEYTKIVVSSRPIPECVAAFDNLPQLRLHDLTRADITSYVQDVIGNHVYMKRLLRRHPEEGGDIVESIIQKSSGVFLWVILACRALLRGFADYDRISELRRRADELPPELEDMFQHMLSKISTRHREHGSRLLRVCFTHRKSQQGNQHEEMYALGLALVDDYHSNPVDLRLLTHDDKSELCEELEGRLRSRCGGLLELQERRLSGLVDAKVVFMHRTVFEFLDNPQVWEKNGCLKTPDCGFNTFAALSLYGLHLAMQSLQKDIADSSAFLLKGLQWALQSDKHWPEDPGLFFENLEPLLDTPGISYSFSNDTLWRLSEARRHDDAAPDSYTTFLLAIEAGAVNYVKKSPCLSAMVQHGRRVGKHLPPLYHAVQKPMLYGAYREFRAYLEFRLVSKDVIALLLSSGCNPNERVFDEDKSTPWTTWLEYIQTFGYDEQVEGLSLIRLFLEAGSDPDPPGHDLVGFVETRFIAREASDAVRQSARDIIRFIRVLRKAESASSTSEETISDTTSGNDMDASDAQDTHESEDTSSNEADDKRKGANAEAVSKRSEELKGSPLRLDTRLPKPSAKEKRAISAGAIGTSQAKRSRHH